MGVDLGVGFRQQVTGPNLGDRRETVISLNLGMFNLFPFPILDGGHLLFLAIEKLNEKGECINHHRFIRPLRLLPL